MKKNFASFIVLVIFFVFLFTFTQRPSLDNIKEVKIAGQSIKIDLALTKDQQEQGLSDRQGLSDNEGMLFVFDRPDKYPFWMKDMNFAIDIIWIGEDMSVVYIKKDARPELYPEIYGPGENAKYVLEVVSGFSEKNNLKGGNNVQFLY